MTCMTSTSGNPVRKSYELRHAEAVSQAELAGRLDVTLGAISKLEHSDDVRVSTLRQYLDALGARLELVAVFDDDDRKVPIHLGRDDACPERSLPVPLALVGRVTTRSRRPYPRLGEGHANRSSRPSTPSFR